jgi:hypothetical protein
MWKELYSTGDLEIMQPDVKKNQKNALLSLEEEGNE